MKVNIEILKSEFKFLSFERRKIIIDEMSRLEKGGIDCFQCTGECCTFTSNSMQTTPLEAVEVLLYLYQEKRVNDTLVMDLESNIKRYRLDSVPGNGQRSFMRRTYTCPFFLGKSKGCSLSRSIKPYGCLGFNPNIGGQTEGGNCASNIRFLEQREKDHVVLEEQLNQQLKDRLDIHWEKLPFPVALFELIEKVEISF